MLIRMLVVLSLAFLRGVPVMAAPAELPMEAPGPQGLLRGSYLAPEGRAGAEMPVLLIIPGSGPTDRDGNSPLGVRAASYRLLAEALAARGVASLRVDKRGMFASAAAQADPNQVTIDDYAVDARAWLGVLRARTGASCVWLAGHSEGGLVALAAAQQADGVCGLVLLATPGRPLGAVLLEQLSANPANAPILAPARQAVAQLERGEAVDVRAMHPGLQALFAPAVQGFLQSVMRLDPAQLAADYRGPLLILQGERDLQVGVTDARRLSLAQPRARLVLLPGVNHVLKVVASEQRGPNLASYADPNLPLAPGVAEAVADFVRRP